MAITATTVRNAAMQHLFGITPWTAPLNFYVALSISAPNADGTNVSEPIGNGYSRAEQVGWIETAPGGLDTVENSTSLLFPTLTGDWGTISHFVIYDASIAGNFLAYGALTNAIKPVSGDTPYFAAGEIKVKPA